MTTTNLPAAGEITLDHSGHFVRDAKAARAALTALGFTVTPFSAQVQPDPDTGQARPTGTGNVCVMLERGYLEILVHTADTPLGREFQAALDRRAGLHLCAFGVPDAAERHAHLVRGGQPMRPLVRLSRKVQTDTGEDSVRFAVARLQAGAMPEGRVQFVTHFNEAAMWQPRWLAHDNGARALTGIVVAAPDPPEAAARFETFLGRPAVQVGAGLTIALDRGTVEFLPTDAARALVGVSVDPDAAAFAAIRIAVDDPRRLAALAQAAGLAATEVKDLGGCWRVPFPDALGRGAFLVERAA